MGLLHCVDLVRDGMVSGMKQILLILAVVALVGGCASTPKVIPNSPEAKAAIESEIRKRANKPTGELTKVDLEKVRHFENHGTGVTDLKPLAGLKNVGYLLLEGNKITDMRPLAGMWRLDYLAISHNPITSLNGLEGLNRLRDLRIYDCQITDLSPLAKLTSLRIIILNGNPINDLAPLAGLKGLRSIDLRRIPTLTKAEVDKLKKALPKCSIGSDFD